MSPPADSSWKRLGELLVRQRIELDPAYANRQAFVAGRRVNYRTVYDIEKGRRENYEPGTITALEVAYGVMPGSIRRTLAGGDLEPLPADAPRIAAVPDPVTPREPRDDDADEVIEKLIEGSKVLTLLWHYPDPDGPVGKLLDRGERLAMMRAYFSGDPRGVPDDEDRNGTGG